MVTESEMTGVQIWRQAMNSDIKLAGIKVTDIELPTEEDDEW